MPGFISFLIAEYYDNHVGHRPTSNNRGQRDGQAGLYHWLWLSSILPRSPTFPPGVLSVLETSVHDQWSHPLQGPYRYNTFTQNTYLDDTPLNTSRKLLYSGHASLQLSWTWWQIVPNANTWHCHNLVLHQCILSVHICWFLPVNYRELLLWDAT